LLQAVAIARILVPESSLAACSEVLLNRADLVSWELRSVLWVTIYGLNNRFSGSPTWEKRAEFVLGGAIASIRSWVEVAAHWALITDNSGAVWVAFASQ
jgi:hypothetical protein